MTQVNLFIFYIYDINNKVNCYFCNLFVSIKEKIFLFFKNKKFKKTIIFKLKKNNEFLKLKKIIIRFNFYSMLKKYQKSFYQRKS